ncbi:GLPGLI family protein [Terrimonas sp. NA20]|uniref:GLPGLI family protein n=1 Tax=Terrimonas ginsenosidimutans TaxID=2908004 RepID=A0ABS9KP23_9BACT|nr:GLPGLI family protein [Terrimonas ginsenosidimutans]MCG2614056.1 GLPGLI family protein [Terrimonas ginsenosidimutans]
MKKALLSGLIALCLSSFSFAQERESSVVCVIYDAVHVSDTNNRSNPFKEEMLLIVGPTLSKYVNNANRAEVKKMRQAAAAPSSAPVRVAVGMPVAVVNAYGVTSTEVFQQPSKQKLNVTASLGMNDYLIEYTLPKINWKISNDTRKIDTYTCQRATGEYAGRVYTAWFTPELSFSTGPWKLSGLPGLILEAEDDKQEVKFVFKSINKDTTEHTGTERRKLVKVTDVAFRRAEDAYFQNPSASMQSQLSLDAPVRLAYRDHSGKMTMGDDAARLIEENKKKKETSYNNPIERTK